MLNVYIPTHININCCSFIDGINYSLEYLEIIPLSTVSHNFVLSKIKWVSLSVSVVVTIQPPPLYGPTNMTNSSVMAYLERNGNIVYNISIQQRSCLEETTAIFIVDCPLNVQVIKFTVYTNRTITALSNDNGIITCVNGVWPNTTIIGKS